MSDSRRALIPPHDCEAFLTSSEITLLTNKLRKLEESLRASEAMASAGSNAASALEAAVGPVEVLSYLIHLSRLDARDEEKVIEYMEAAEEEVHKLSRILLEALRYYRDKTGRGAPGPRPQ